MLIDTHILIVDDEPDIRSIISDILADEGFNTHTAKNADEAREVMTKVEPGIVLLDIWMPGTDGITLLKEWIDSGCTSSIIMISGHGTVDTAVEAIRLGAYDFLEKPLSTAKLLVTVDRALQTRRLSEENLNLRSQLEPATKLIGESSTLTLLRQKIDRFAATDNWILVTGETGAGRGVVCRLLHQRSRRANASFIEINLGALPAENIAIQLFGQELDQSTPGSLEQANGGTLVLDEVGDLDSDLQTKLLSALEERSFFRVGGRTSVQFDVRVIATTNQPLRAMVDKGLFRRDLYDRLNQLPIEVPPLRSHRDDITALVSSMVSRAVEEEGYPYRRFSPGALNQLRSHHWPGNVRELQNMVRRLIIISESEEISSADVQGELSGQPKIEIQQDPSNLDGNLRDAREEFERTYLLHHLKLSGGNMTELAIRTGLERTHLYRKMKSLGIDNKAIKKSGKPKT